MTDCKLIPGFFGVFIQGLLGVMSVTALYCKWRYLEIFPKRPIEVFRYDFFKQIMVSLYAHLINMLIAYCFYKGTDSKDECGMYTTNYLLDTTVGMFLNISFLKMLNNHYVDKMNSTVYPAHVNKYFHRISGNYKDQNTMLYQTFTWGCCVTLSKFMVFFIELAFINVTVTISNNILSWVGSPKWELAVVMLLCPLLMNSIQFCIQDKYLKSCKNRSLDLLNNNFYTGTL